MGQMEVVGIRVESPAAQPVLLLREIGGERYLAIWIGQNEAASIALHQKGIEPPRPLTHDLIVDLVETFGQHLEQVRIVDMREGTFYAEMVFTGSVVVSARPSDAVAVAMRTGAQIHADEEVLVEAGLVIPDEDEVEGAGLKEDEVERFKEFLDQISPDDFNLGEEK